MYIDNEGNYDFSLDMDEPFPVKFIKQRAIKLYDGVYREVECTNRIESVVDENGNKATLITTVDEKIIRF